MTPDTDSTTLDYWLNWRFLLCLIWVLSCMVLASYMIWKYEGASEDEDSQCQQEAKPSLYNADEAWMPCVRGIHPAWLMAFRIFGFLVLFALLMTDIIVDGIGVLYFYTQWTFTTVTIYFGLGSVLSIYGCCQYSNKILRDHVASDAERGTYVAPTYDENGNTCNIGKIKYSQANQQHYVNHTAGAWANVFLVLFQMNAGAVILTDCVFWLIIYPFLSANDTSLSVMKIITHSVNAVFLIGDTALNGLQFPLFRIAYFILWTGTFVIFQWVVHAFVSLRWPYPILELASPYAPLWYVVVGLLHIPSYGFFTLLVKLKCYLLSKCTPHSTKILK